MLGSKDQLITMYTVKWQRCVFLCPFSSLSSYTRPLMLPINSPLRRYSAYCDIYVQKVQPHLPMVRIPFFGRRRVLLIPRTAPPTYFQVKPRLWISALWPCLYGRAVSYASCVGLLNKPQRHNLTFSAQIRTTFISSFGSRVLCCWHPCRP